MLDIAENNQHRARNFFLENKIGDFYIIKRIQFEDAETIFYNSGKGEEELFVNGLSICANSKDSLVLQSKYQPILPNNTNKQICLFKINSRKIDTLQCFNTDWFSSFSFFDKNDSSIYYIHSFYKNNNLVETYAKMNYYTNK